MKKKIIAMCLIISLATVALIGGTLAFFTDTKAASNVFTVGNVEIKLEEPGWDGPNGTGKADAAEVYPGEPLAKDPTVTNIGDNPCFVRVKVFGLDSLVNAGPIQIRNADGTLGQPNPDWTLIDGYYYYNKPLIVAGTGTQTWNTGLLTETPKLFNHIVIPTGLENGNASTTFYVDVVAQAVQAQGARPAWTDVKLMTPAEIAAWFTTCQMPVAVAPTH